MNATDMKLTDVTKILAFKHVLFVDVSGNRLDQEALDVLADMPYLVLLKAERNVIGGASFRPMPYLQTLALGANRVADTRAISQPYLDALDLSDNAIARADFDGDLPALKQLDLHGNRLDELGGALPTSIEKLFVAQNRIASIREMDVAKLINLKVLHLRANRLRKLDGFTKELANLRYINLRSNDVRSLRQFHKLRCLPKLDTLIVSDNPVSGLYVAPGEATEDEAVEDEEGASKSSFRISLLVMLPRLERIDKIPVTAEERDEAFFIEDERYGEIMAEGSSEEDEIANGTAATTDYTTETESEDIK